MGASWNWYTLMSWIEEDVWFNFKYVTTQTHWVNNNFIPVDILLLAGTHALAHQGIYVDVKQNQLTRCGNAFITTSANRWSDFLYMDSLLRAIYSGKIIKFAKPVYHPLAKHCVKCFIRVHMSIYEHFQKHWPSFSYMNICLRTVYPSTTVKPESQVCHIFAQRIYKMFYQVTPGRCNTGSHGIFEYITDKVSMPERSVPNYSPFYYLWGSCDKEGNALNQELSWPYFG